MSAFYISTFYDKSKQIQRLRPSEGKISEGKTFVSTSSLQVHNFPVFSKNLLLM